MLYLFQTFFILFRYKQKGHFPTNDKGRLEAQCFKANWVYHLIHDGFGFPPLDPDDDAASLDVVRDDANGVELRIADQIGNVQVSWTLGALLVIWSQNSRDTSVASHRIRAVSQHVGGGVAFRPQRATSQVAGLLALSLIVALAMLLLMRFTRQHNRIFGRYFGSSMALAPWNEEKLSRV